MSVLEIKNLHVSVEDKEILKGLNLTLKTGEIAAIMGPNGTGKSTLSAAIMGNPNYEVTEGDILFDGESILDLEVDERARLGLFLAMQYPAEIPGITNAEFIRAAMKVVSKGVNAMRGEGFGAMIITHYQRLLNYITPDVVHVMMEGKVVLSGGPELAARLEQEGYAKIAEELGYEYHEEA